MCCNPSVKVFVTITLFLPLSLRQDGVFCCSLQLCNLKKIYIEYAIKHAMFKGKPRWKDCWLRRQIMDYDSGSRPKVFAMRSELIRLSFLLSSSSELIQLPEMENSSQSSSERILLEPYKYLLQLPGESLLCPDFRALG